MVVTDEVWLIHRDPLHVSKACTMLQCGSGHESAGEVVEVGEGVTQWKIGEISENANAEELTPYYSGDRVAIEAGVPCSKSSCDYCRIGRYNACKFSVCSIIRQSIMCDPFLGPDVVFFSTPPFHGMNPNFPGVIDI